MIVIVPGGGATNPPGAAIAETSSYQYPLLYSVTQFYIKNKTNFTMQSFRLSLINRREFIHQSFITRLAMFLRNYCDITFMYTLVIFMLSSSTNTV